MSLYREHGMTTPTCRRVQVVANGSPQTDRYVSLTTTRLFATNVYVVAVVDGTGRLADPKSLLTTTDYQRARRHANRLTESWGGEVPPPDTAEFLASRRRRRHRSEYIDPPTRTRDGRWVVRWRCVGSPTAKGKRFSTEPEAQAFYAQLTEESDR
jgi:hypothetical protein